MNEKTVDRAAVLEALKPYDIHIVNENLEHAMRAFQKKIIVLDDDPTGVQTVHDIYVYTDWSKESIRQGFQDEKSMFFILTNSRGFTGEETRRMHAEIARNITEVSKETGKDFLIISRSDSTLRGHYPIETLVLKEHIEELTDKKMDGEIIMQCAGRFDYPKDQDIRRYRYPDGSENYDFEKSVFAKKKKESK